MTKMLELIERLEAASGGREMDGLLARQFGWHRVEPRFSRSKHGAWIAPEDFIGLNSDGSPRLDGLHGTTMHRDSPPFTTSLDAALALAERVLPGARIVTDSACKETGLPAAGIIYGQTDSHIDGIMSDGNTLALALVIATLKAVSAKGEGG